MIAASIDTAVQTLKKQIHDRRHGVPFDSGAANMEAVIRDWEALTRERNILKGNCENLSAAIQCRDNEIKSLSEALKEREAQIKEIDRRRIMADDRLQTIAKDSLKFFAARAIRKHLTNWGFLVIHP